LPARFVGAVREEAKPETAAAVGAGDATAPRTELSLPDKPSIAVLPLANLSGNPEEDYFADGMAEEIITALSRCAWLFVIATYSIFRTCLRRALSQPSNPSSSSPRSSG
jgi:TolB-like protein